MGLTATTGVPRLPGVSQALAQVAASVITQRRHSPIELVLVRHGESLGNLADRAARDQGAGRLDLDARDADVQLSPDGERQATALGDYVRRLGPDDGPTVVACSPYQRAYDTARLAVAHLGSPPLLVTDERLRERDLGIFDGLTGRGITAEHPAEAERRGRVGKFYYRPPCGESWCDVALRVRSVLADIGVQYEGERVWVFSHQAVIMSFRMVLEELGEHELLDIDSSTPLPNCSMTTYRRGAAGRLALVAAGDTSAVDESAAPVTKEQDSTDRSTPGGGS